MTGDMPIELGEKIPPSVRMPTVAEACDFLLRFRGDIYKDYRRSYLIWFRERTTDAEADQLAAAVKVRW